MMVDKMNKFLMLALFGMFMLGGLNASMNCTYDNTPNMGSRTVIACSGVPSSSHCYSIFGAVNSNQKIMLPSDLGPGMVFAPQADASGSIAFPYEVTGDFVSDANYSFNMQCSNSTTATNYTGLVAVQNGRNLNTMMPSYMIWLRDNSIWLIMGFVGILVILFVLSTGSVFKKFIGL